MPELHFKTTGEKMEEILKSANEKDLKKQKEAIEEATPSNAAEIVEELRSIINTELKVGFATSELRDIQYRIGLKLDLLKKAIED